jgi:hypothetical protein
LEFRGESHSYTSALQAMKRSITATKSKSSTDASKISEGSQRDCESGRRMSSILYVVMEDGRTVSRFPHSTVANRDIKDKTPNHQT